ncbi:MAG: tryptophan--tRNA ligase [Candidatus Nanoarchaeia archaeon]|jgi:tryptophanyl-tRNA synthetase
MADNVVSAFGTSEIRDYDKLLREFGVESFSKVKLSEPLIIMRRAKVFGQRDLKSVINAMKNGKRFAVVSGIKPSSQLHIGSKLIVDQIVYFQNHGGLVYYPIADLESLVDNGLELDKARLLARDNLLDLAALGIDFKKARIYFQSEEVKVQRLAYVYSRNVTNNMLKAIYGEHPIGMYMAALIQVADILLPQIEHGPMPVVVPVGFDQDPHIRLTRDIAVKHGLVPPSSTYVKFISSLLGVERKMSKREPQGMIMLSESPKDARKKIMKYAFSGGQATVEAHRKKGGDPDVDVAYQYLTYFESDDKKLKKVFDDYKAGRLLSGELKVILADKIESFLIEHQAKRKKAEVMVDKFLKKTL